ncbi:MAG: ZIP family metal transporter [Legionella sp.]|nr:ZIP family metal transporter [Legionella sp.]
MISASILKIIFAITTTLVILLAGWYPFKRKMHHGHDGHVDFSIGETLATGVFLGAGLLHMLPEANELFHEMHYQYPLAFIISGAVFLIFLWFEHLGRELYHHHAATSPAFAVMAWSMLSLHSLMLGTALGLNHSNSMVIVLFLAIITHKWAESFAIAVQLTKSTLNRYQSLVLFLVFSLMTPLGIFIGWYFERGVETNSVFDPVLMAASAGTFLYLGTLHGLERCVLVEKCCNLRDFSFVIIGFLLMGSVAAYV